MTLIVDRPFHLKPIPGRTGGYKLKARSGHEPEPVEAPAERIHPLARRMALAIEAKRLIESGVVADAAEMARVAGLTRARMTQILNLTLLAPDIQEGLLSLKPSASVNPAELRLLSMLSDWRSQRAILSSRDLPSHDLP